MRDELCNIYEKKGGINSEIDNHPVKYFDEGGSLELGWEGYEKRISQIEFVKDSHRALSDVYESIEELRFYRDNLFKNN